MSRTPKTKRTRTAPYTPRPGSLAEHVVHHLRLHGGTLDRGQIVSAFNVEGNAVANSLKPAVLAGLLTTAKQGRGFVWSLAGAQDGTEPADAQGASASTTGAAAPQRRKRLAEVAAEHQVSARAQAAELITMAAWADGDVTVKGPQVAEDGETIIFTRQQLAAMFLLLTQPHLVVATTPAPGRNGNSASAPANDATFADLAIPLR